MVRHQPLGPESVAAERAASADPVAVVDSVDEELLGVRVLRQVRTGLDVERLLLSAAKRESDVRKRLAKMAERAGLLYLRGRSGSRGRRGQGAGAPECGADAGERDRDSCTGLPDFVVHRKSVHRPKGGFARVAGALNLPRLSARRRDVRMGWFNGRAGRRNGSCGRARRRRCRSMRGCVGSGSRCCAGTPDSEPIGTSWRMLSSGPARVVVSTTTGRIVEAAGAAAWALWRASSDDWNGSKGNDSKNRHRPDSGRCRVLRRTRAAERSIAL